MRSTPAVIPDPEALTVAMAIVPGVYSRNRYFDLFAAAEVRRARRRAALLRGLARELAGSHGEVDGFAVMRDEEGAELRYRVRAMRVSRRVTLSELETSCLAFLAERAGAGQLAVTEKDRRLLENALRRLAPGLRLEGAA
jgi:hypothetical protein